MFCFAQQAIIYLQINYTKRSSRKALVLVIIKAWIQGLVADIVNKKRSTVREYLEYFFAEIKLIYLKDEI